MRKNGNIKFRAIDAAVIFLCLLGAAAFLFLFYRDLNRSLRRLNEEPVGFVVSSTRAALRRFQDRSLWDRLRKESPVYNGDFIRTVERSETAIAFPGGNLVGISENSLIRVFVGSEGPRIDFARGNISVHAGTGEGLTVSMGGNQIKAAAGAVVSFDAGTGEEETFSLQVIEGEASFITPDGERELTAGTSVSLETGGMEAGETRLSVLEPRPAARFLAPPDVSVPVAFNWNSDSGPARLEIAGDRDFSRTLTVWEGEAAGSITTEVPPGTWWWRVSLSGESAPDKEARGQFSVASVPPPALVSPAPEAAYHYQTEPPELRFLWVAPEEASYCILEAADNPEMADPVLRTEVRYNSLVYSDLAAGRWYWRVTPVFSVLYQGSVPASPVVPFTIVREDPSLPSQGPEIAEAVPAEAPPPEAVPAETALPEAVEAPAVAVRPAEPLPTVIEEPPVAQFKPPIVRAAELLSVTRPEPPPPPPPAPPPLTAASGRTPESGFVLNPEFLSRSRTIVFSWNPVEGADFYAFTLFREAASGVQRPIISFEGPGTSYTLNDLSRLDVGRFVWQVEAVSRKTGEAAERRGPPGTNWFIVDIPQPSVPRAGNQEDLYGR